MKLTLNFQPHLWVIISSIILAGCAGKNSSSSSEQTFSSWSATVPLKITNFTAGNATRVLANGTTQQTYSDVTAVTSFDVSRNLTAVTLRQSGLNTISFSISNGDTIVKDSTNNNFVLTNNRSTTIGIIANPFNYGYEYQTYGSWGNWGSVGAGSNAVSIGSFTPANNVPVIGNATFQGGANGYYVLNGLSYIASASMTANADFASRTITFTTADTKLVGTVSGATLSASSLNLSGSIAYGPNSNLLTGSVTSASGLSGSIVGNFYGPNANEIGGTFGLNKSSGETFVGGFGGKR
jgi:hypothetical protein